MFALENQSFETRAISPLNELGAYEALWSRQGTTFKTIADIFREHPNAVPSDFVGPRERSEFGQKALSLAKKAGVHGFGVRVHGAGEYPEQLRDAIHPIELLYYRGWWDLVATPSVAVVGTRNPSSDGEQRTRKLVRSLVDAGFTVVSGLAKGIDTIAHTTAIEFGGYTIAVIGTAITSAFPSENSKLQELIAKDYLVISQVPICRFAAHFKANKQFFPERNITMSALTKATIIVEASDTSGTLIQARAAINQGRKLFILDNCFRNPDISWPAKYAEKGAIRVRDFEDIRHHLAETSLENRRTDAT